MRLLPALVLLASVAAPVAAAPLCRDLKGLAHPCTGERVAAKPERVAARPSQGTTPVAGETPAGTPAAGDAAAPARRARPVIARARLCRDLKGLAHPCV